MARKTTKGPVLGASEPVVEETFQEPVDDGNLAGDVLAYDPAQNCERKYYEGFQGAESHAYDAHYEAYRCPDKLGVVHSLMSAFESIRLVHQAAVLVPVISDPGHVDPFHLQAGQTLHDLFDPGLEVVPYLFDVGAHCHLGIASYDYAGGT